MEQEFGLDKEFEIVELEPRRASSPDVQIGSGGSGGSGASTLGSGGSGGSGASTLGSGGSGT